MTSDAPFLDLVERLYGGLTHTPPWEDFLRALADATGATFATLIIGRGRRIDAHVTPGVDPGRVQAYRQLSQTDPFVGLPEGRVVSFRDFVQHVPARFRDFMDLSRTGQILGVDLQREPDIYVRLRVTRDHSRPDFADGETALIERLIPHLRIALDLHARLTTTQAESQLFGSAMADLAVATLILDREGRILRRNAMAERMMKEDGTLYERGGKIEFTTQGATALIARLLATPPAPGEECQIELAGAQGPPLHARAKAVPSSAYGDGAWLALFLADGAPPPGPSADMLRDRFQLTRAEAALALLLAQGRALTDAAKALDIAYNTARSHLRAIFAKTGTHRQVELVTLLRSAGTTAII
ncbi:DNA-binding CsgD family transcriptional regulator [Sphingobium sp. OAS761]|uniref:helix-turn-helix transcriptional regulator n=1 Tax=Sphingobium sp. OAS761 TaxID=2817901 RepID=UPI00209D949E|nr:helix-turn-helix transcriptional regulator [Sphingobium sp. OAS761]MCP1471761.1 DNA-binding CsgD family transcriptional regulator [Sphingobium sp. OAS761]